jgi:hypothetical protein
VIGECEKDVCAAAGFSPSDLKKQKAPEKNLQMEV